MTVEACPFSFNFDAATFQAGDCVSYRVTGSLSGMPFVGTLVEVHAEHVLLHDASDPGGTMSATRESRPVVAEDDLA
jgi:hypothetical protein